MMCAATAGQRGRRVVLIDHYAKIGEKIAVRRFVRYELVEGIDKKNVDFAAEIAETLKVN